MTKIIITWHLPSLRQGDQFINKNILGEMFITMNIIIASHIYCKAKYFPWINSFNPPKPSEVISILQIQKLRFKSIVQSHKTNKW